MGKLFKLVSSMLHRAALAVVVLLASVMLLSIGWQVVMRFAFNRPPSWTEELALLCFSWIVLLMLAVGVREAFHARIDLLDKLLPTAWVPWLERGLLLITAAFGAYLAKGGATYVIETATATSAAMAYPIYALHVAAPVCGVLIACFALELLWLGSPNADSPAKATAP